MNEPGAADPDTLNPMPAQTILIVEDNPITRKMVRVALESEGYTVVEAEDGAAAVACLQSQPVDLVLQDLLLPDVDGRELVRQLRALPYGETVPILAFSGFLTDLEPSSNSRMGFTDFLFKPVDLSRLLEIIRIYLQIGVASGAAPGAGHQVLIADDEPINLKLLKLQLEQLGFRVRAAGDGIAALEEARRQRPDVIVADVLMPRMDGFRFCRALRDDPELADLPVVLYSAAYTEEADQQLARHVGANALVLRDPDLRELTSVLLREIGQAAPRPSAASEETSEEYTFRVIRQLENQVRINATVSQRLAILEAKLAVFAGLAETLQRTSSMETVLDELLPCCLEAAQLSRGALFLLDETGTPRLRTHLGYAPVVAAQLGDFFGRSELLGKILATGEPVQFLPEGAGGPDAAYLLTRLQASTALVVPITTEGRCLGGLVLASIDQELSKNWSLFARALGGQIGQSLALTEAISERKQAEAALREGEERFRALADPMPQIVWTADADGTIHYCNQRWLEYAGIPINQVQSGGWGAVVHAEDLAALRRHWSRSIASWKPLELEMRLKRAVDGSFRWHQVRALPYRDSGGRVVRWYGSMTDIDDQKQAVEQLAEADRRKNEFLAMLAHELRNPLSAVSSALHVMQLSGSDTVAFERARSIAARQVLHQTRMVDDLLDVSRITRSKIEIRSDSVELVSLLEECVEDYRAELERFGLELRVTLPEPPLLLTGDPPRLAQVFANLLHNAVKFSAPGGCVSVEMEVEPPPAVTDASREKPATAVIRIRDEGIGIEPDLLPHIFETFRQADTSLDRGRGGLGMGLALVKGLVELHGGSVVATSGGLNQGALLTVRLPLAKDRIPLAPAGNRVPLTSPAAAAGAPLRLLIVEDNRDAAESLRDLLEIPGHEVELAHTGPDGLEAARRLRPAIVICDIGLPGMDGYRVAEELRRDPRTADTCLIALTGYGGQEDRKRALASGYDLHLTKPVQPEELLKLLSQCVRPPSRA